MGATPETAEDCAKRVGVPVRHDDRPELWAMAKVSWEFCGNGPWESLPYFCEDSGDTDQLLRLLYAKGELEELRKLGFDIIAVAEVGHA